MTWMITSETKHLPGLWNLTQRPMTWMNMTSITEWLVVKKQKTFTWFVESDSILHDLNDHDLNAY